MDEDDENKWRNRIIFGVIFFVVLLTLKIYFGIL